LAAAPAPSYARSRRSAALLITRHGRRALFPNFISPPGLRFFKKLPSIINVYGFQTDFDMRAALKRMTLDRYGATVIEYAMIAFFVSIAAFSAILTIGTDVTAVFTRISTSF
jgi:pilus assembly protein Flp/PilA